MKIAIIGATGKLGAILTSKLSTTENTITAIVRDTNKLTQNNIHVIQKNLFDITCEDIEAFDVVINAFGPALHQEQMLVTSMQYIVSIFMNNNKTRLIVCGGVGPLYLDEKKQSRVSESPHVPAEFIALAQAETQAYQLLSQNKTFDWTYFAPPLQLDFNSIETKQYQTNLDVLHFSHNGSCRLSYADFASAICDEVITPKFHPQKLVSVISTN